MQFIDLGKQQLCQPTFVLLGLLEFTHSFLVNTARVVRRANDRLSVQ